MFQIYALRTCSLDSPIWLPLIVYGNIESVILSQTKDGSSSHSKGNWSICRMRGKCLYAVFLCVHFYPENEGGVCGCQCFLPQSTWMLKKTKQNKSEMEQNYAWITECWYHLLSGFTLLVCFGLQRFCFQNFSLIPIPCSSAFVLSSPPLWIMKLG